MFFGVDVDELHSRQEMSTLEEERPSRRIIEIRSAHAGLSPRSTSRPQQSTTFQEPTSPSACLTWSTQRTLFEPISNAISPWIVQVCPSSTLHELSHPSRCSIETPLHALWLWTPLLSVGPAYRVALERHNAIITLSLGLFLARIPQIVDQHLHCTLTPPLLAHDTRAKIY